MAQRIMMVVTPETVTDNTRIALEVARAARQSGGVVRILYVTPIPPPRVDRYGRVVADTDREMARIAAGAEEKLRVMAADLDGVPVERVVRFGGLSEEIAIEADAFGADLVALAPMPSPALGRRILGWRLGRLAAPSRGMLLLLPPSAGMPVQPR